MIRRLCLRLAALFPHVDELADPNRMTGDELADWLRGCPTDDDTEFAAIAKRLTCVCVDCTRNQVKR